MCVRTSSSISFLLLLLPILKKRLCKSLQLTIKSHNERFLGSYGWLGKKTQKEDNFLLPHTCGLFGNFSAASDKQLWQCENFSI